MFQRGKVFVVGGLLAVMTLPARAAVRGDQRAVMVSIALALALWILRFPETALVAALPGAFLVKHAALPGGIAVPIADLALVAAIIVALRVLVLTALHRALLGAVAVYQASLLVTVVAHPSGTALNEWGHRALLAAGSIVVGAALARLGLATSALRLYVAASVIVAVAAISDTLASGFRPAYPLGLHKNAAGWLLCMSLIMVVSSRHVLRLGPRLAALAATTIGLGLLGCQARGAMVAFVLVAGLGAARRATSARSLLLMACGVCVMLAVVGVVTSRELNNAQTARFAGIHTRLETNDNAFELWQESPLFGAGLTYYLLGTSSIEPHNFVVEAAAESGVLGIAGFVILLWTAARVARRCAGDFAVLARTLFYARIVEAMFGIFWVAGMGSVSWIVLGIAASAAPLITSDTTPLASRALRSL